MRVPRVVMVGVAVVVAWVASAEPALAAPLHVTVTRADDRNTSGACASSLATTPDCSLREAIELANASGLGTNITFDIGGGGNQSIVLTGPLPSISKQVSIDGTTQPGTSNPTPIRLDGSGAGGAANGLTLTSGQLSQITGLSVIDFGNNGIVITGDANNIRVTDDVIGTDQAGTRGGNGGAGIVVEGSANEVQIGPMIGGPASDGVVVAGNGGPGILVSGTESPPPQAVTITSDYIGVGVDGMTPDPNSVGIEVNQGATGVQIGSQFNQPMIISGNSGAGVLLASDAGLVGVINSVIGLGSDGETAVPNGTGVDSAAANAVFGVSCQCQFTALGDTIAGNTGAGMILRAGADGTTIFKSRIGVDVAGSAARPNGGAGLDIEGANNVSVGDGTVVAGNRGDGIKIAGNGLVLGATSIGVSGTKPIPNAGDGIDVTSGTGGVIGGGSAATSPDIEDNRGAGIFFAAPAADTGWRIGWPTIENNTGLGIDLAPRGVTPNDPVGGHVNFPVLTSVGGGHIVGTYHGPPNTTVAVSFYSSSACDPSTFGEGTAYLSGHSATVIKTNAAGDAQINAAYAVASPPGPVVTAVAQTPAGISEFGNCVLIDNANPSLSFAPRTYTAPEGATQVLVMVKRSGPTAFPSIVHVTSTGGTAKANIDYKPVSVALQFGAGQTVMGVPVTLLKDPSLKSNATVTLTLSQPTLAKIGSPASATVTIVAGGPSSRIAPFKGRQKAGKLKSFHGTASAGAGVRRVAIAVVRVMKHGCAALGRDGKLHRSSCGPTLFLDAHGTTTWHYRLSRRLPKGSYVVYSRATDARAVAESKFTTALGNRRTFKLV